MGWDFKREVNRQSQYTENENEQQNRMNGYLQIIAVRVHKYKNIALT